MMMNQTSNTLNPYANEYYPNLLTPFNYPTPPNTISPTFFTIFYRTIHTNKPTMFYSNQQTPVVPPPAQPTTPTLKSEIGSDHVVGRAVCNRRPSKLGRVVPRQQDRGNRVWVRKDALNHPLAKYINYPFGDSTTLMIRNIPVRYSRVELMQLLDEQCRIENEKISSVDDYADEPPAEFDFLYLPIDFKRKGNLGYAFVNFTTWQGALRLYKAWNGAAWDNCPYQTQKIRRISRAKFQGKDELRSHFQKSVFVCESQEYLPVEIIPARNGVNSDRTKLVTIGSWR